MSQLFFFSKLICYVVRDIQYTSYITWSMKKISTYICIYIRVNRPGQISSYSLPNGR